jgi:hypothetical protein
MPCPVKSRASGDENGIGDYRKEGGDLPGELLAKEPGSCNLEGVEISVTVRSIALKGLEIIPNAK